MFKHPFITAMLFAATIGIVSAQPRRMTFVGGGSPDRGKCTVEVRVDGAAEVEIHGDTADLRNLGVLRHSGGGSNAPDLCRGIPAEFRFAGVDGRGRQQLVFQRSSKRRLGGRSHYRSERRFGRLYIRHHVGRGGDLLRPPSRAAVTITTPSGEGLIVTGTTFIVIARKCSEAGIGGRICSPEFVRTSNTCRASTFPFGSDQYRISRANQELNESCRTWLGLPGRFATGANSTTSYERSDRC